MDDESILRARRQASRFERARCRRSFVRSPHEDGILSAAWRPLQVDLGPQRARLDRKQTAPAFLFNLLFDAAVSASRRIVFDVG